jgi:hypothetical protein
VEWGLYGRTSRGGNIKSKSLLFTQLITSDKWFRRVPSGSFNSRSISGPFNKTYQDHYDEISLYKYDKDFYGLYKYDKAFDDLYLECL